MASSYGVCVWYGQHWQFVRCYFPQDSPHAGTSRFVSYLLLIFFLGGTVDLIPSASHDTQLLLIQPPYQLHVFEHVQALHSLFHTTDTKLEHRAPGVVERRSCTILSKHVCLENGRILTSGQVHYSCLSRLGTLCCWFQRVADDHSYVFFLMQNA